MRALLAGDTAAIAVLGLSPWIIPLIAVAAKLTYAQTRSAFRSECPQNRPDDTENTRRDGGARNQEVLHECIEAIPVGRTRPA